MLQYFCLSLAIMHKLVSLDTKYVITVSVTLKNAFRWKIKKNVYKRLYNYDTRDTSECSGVKQLHM